MGLDFRQSSFRHVTRVSPSRGFSVFSPLSALPAGSCPLALSGSGKPLTQGYSSESFPSTMGMLHELLRRTRSWRQSAPCPAFGLDDVRISPPSYQLRCFSRGATTGSEPFVSSTAISPAGRDGPSSVSASLFSFHRLIGRRTCLKAHSATRLPCVRPSTSGLRKWIPE